MNYENDYQIRSENLEEKHFAKAIEKPSFYVEKFLGFEPYGYQIEPLDDPYRFKAITMARQLGKTFILAAKASWQINLFSDSRVAIAAQNEKRAFTIYEMVKKFQKRHPVFAEMLDPRNDKKSEMKLANGSLVHFYASGTRGDAIRGDTLDMMILDEADYVPDPVYWAVLPTVSATGGELLFASTPRLPYSMFYEIFQDGWEARQKYEGKVELGGDEEPYTKPVGRKFNFASYHYDYTYGLNVINKETGLPQKDITIVNILKNKDYEAYEREELAQWSAEGGVFISEQSVAAARVKHGRFIADKHQPEYVMGLDLGRINDYTAITILQVTGKRDLGIIVDSFRTRKKNWGVIFKHILHYARKYNVTTLYLDQNNVGDMMQYWLTSVGKRGFEFRVIGVKMSLQSKSKLYHNLKMAINTGRFLIQENTPGRKKQMNEELMKELSQLITEETSTGIMKIHAPDTAGKFDDLADSGALASKGLMIPNDFEDFSPIDLIFHNEGGDFSEYDDAFVSVIEGGTFDTGKSYGNFKPSFEF